jgi:hypothetical protein
MQADRVCGKKQGFKLHVTNTNSPVESSGRQRAPYHGAGVQLVQYHSHGRYALCRLPSCWA